MPAFPPVSRVRSILATWAAEGERLPLTINVRLLPAKVRNHLGAGRDFADLQAAMLLFNRFRRLHIGRRKDGLRRGKGRRSFRQWLRRFNGAATKYLQS